MLFSFIMCVAFVLMTEGSALRVEMDWAVRLHVVPGVAPGSCAPGGLSVALAVAAALRFGLEPVPACVSPEAVRPEGFPFAPPPLGASVPPPVKWGHDPHRAIAQCRMQGC